MLIGALVGLLTGWLLSFVGLPAWLLGTLSVDLPFINIWWYYALFAAIGAVFGYFHK